MKSFLVSLVIMALSLTGFSQSGGKISIEQNKASVVAGDTALFIVDVPEDGEYEVSFFMDTKLIEMEKSRLRAGRYEFRYAVTGLTPGKYYFLVTTGEMREQRTLQVN